MVEFCGWDMPVQFSTGTLTEHLHTRNHVGLFDVSHMCQLILTGKDHVKFLESLVVGDVGDLPNGQAILSVLTNEKGGIIDDTVITKEEKQVFMVVNAGCADKDLAHLKQKQKEAIQKGWDVNITQLSTHGLIAFQGPEAATVLKRVIPGGDKWGNMPFMTSRVLSVPEYGQVRISRCGYTGEDGFEVSVVADKAEKLGRAMLSHKEVAPIGLGARDSLRLESGLCLYGHDLNDTITPVEASLAWTIGKRRRQSGGFLGADVILKQLKDGVSKKRVGLFADQPAREHTPIFSADGKTKIGEVTSGTFSPVLKKAVSMAYVETAHSKVGTPVKLEVRQKMINGSITKMPFVPTRYFKP